MSHRSLMRQYLVQRRRPLGLLIVACFFVNGAQAQEVQPGLWEVSTQMKMPDNPELQARMAQAQAQLKNLPPSVRQQLEKSLGVSVADSGAGTTKLRLCLTPEQAKAPMNQPKGSGDCTYQQTRHSDNTISGRITCPPPAGSGEFVTTLHSKNHYSTIGTLQSSQGKMQVNSEAKRISNDCGSVKPLQN